MISVVVSSTSNSVAPGAARPLRAGLVVAALALVGGLLLAVPAQPAAAAGSPQISVSPSSGLNPDKDYVVVTGSGFNENAALFVMQCRNNSGNDHTCNSVGLQRATTDAGGNLPPTRLQVTAYMGSIDCTKTQCAVKTSAIAGHSGDRSQDVLSSISFSAPAPPVTAPPPTAPPATQPPVAQAPVTAPPTTEAPAVTTTTEAPAATTTTVAPSAETTTTTTEAAVDESVAAPTTTSPPKVTELAGGTDAPTRNAGDDRSSPLLAIVGLLVLVLAAVGGGIYVLRARAAN